MNSGFFGSVMLKMSTSENSVLSTITAYASLPSCQMKIECALFGTAAGSCVVGALASSGRVVGRLVAEALHEDLRVGRVAHVVEVEAADAVRAPHGSLLTASTSPWKLGVLSVIVCVPSPW